MSTSFADDTIVSSTISISPAELLRTWERGIDQSLTLRALLMLALRQPDVDRETLARLSIGARDARLLDLREAIFGSGLECLACCAECEEQVELRFEVEEIRAPHADACAAHQMQVEGFAVSFRVPDSTDLLSLAAGQDRTEHEHRLLTRCVLDAHDHGTPVAAEDLPASVAAAVTDRMAELDSQAEVILNLRCPTCGNCWQSLFDIVTHLWSDIDGWARGMLADVHVLARAYGWQEADILSMTSRRRGAYLRMLGAR